MIYLKNIEFLYLNFEHFILIALFVTIIGELKLYSLNLIISCILKV